MPLTSLAFARRAASSSLSRARGENLARKETSCAPLTTAGKSGATAEHAGAASGLVNTFHQLGMALGLGVLVAVSVKAGADAATAGAAAVAQVSAALNGSAVLLGIALLICATLILPKSRRGERASTTPPASISTSASASAQGTSS